MSLFQKDLLFNRRWFNMNDEGLMVTSKSLTSSSEVFVKFEDLGFKIIKSKGGKLGWLITVIVSFLLAIVMYFFEKTGGDTEKSAFLGYLILAIMAAIIYLLTYKSSIFLTDNENKSSIRFLIDKPSKDELSEFIDTLMLKRKNVLILKYGQITNMMSYEQQVNTLNWLNTVDALSNKEYSIKIEELNAVFKKTNPITGFGT